MSDLDKNIGKRLRHARIAGGYKSARSFAREFDIPESTYSQHETGKRSLSPEMLIFYSEKFGVSPGWLVTGKYDSVMLANRVENEKSLKEISKGKTILDLDLFKTVLRRAVPNIFKANSSEDADTLMDYVVNLYNSVIALSENDKPIFSSEQTAVDRETIN